MLLQLVYPVVGCDGDSDIQMVKKSLCSFTGFVFTLGSCQHRSFPTIVNGNVMKVLRWLFIVFFFCLSFMFKSRHAIASAVGSIVAKISMMIPYYMG